VVKPYYGLNIIIIRGGKMKFESILNESLNIEYQDLNKFLHKYDLKPEEKVAVYEFHSSMAKKNKTLTIT